MLRKWSAVPVTRPGAGGEKWSPDDAPQRGMRLVAISSERYSEPDPRCGDVSPAQGELTVPTSISAARELHRLRSDEKLRHRLPTETALRIPLEPPEAVTQQVVTEQVVTAIAHEGPAHAARPSSAGEFPIARGILQWLFEGSGWTVLCPSLDFTLAWVAVLLALGGVSGALQLSPGRFAGFALPALVVLMLAMLGGYRRRLRVVVLDWLRLLVSGVTLALMALAVLDLLNNGQITGRSTWLRMWLLTTITVCCGRTALAVVHRWARSRRLIAQPVLIVGAGLVGTRVARRLEAHPQYGLLPVGFLDDDPRPALEVGGKCAPVLGTIDAIDDALRATGARTVIVAFASATDSRISGLIRHCQGLGIEVAVVPRMFDSINDRVTYDTLGGLPLLGFSSVDPRGWQFAVKHALDWLVAAALLIVLTPLMAGIALAVRLTSNGPIMFRQQRVGRDGKVFDLYKFRSMQWQPTVAPPGSDYRVARLIKRDIGPGGVEGGQHLTRIGGLLRGLSLDELPQLINVLKGDMSIVGPRPERPEFVELFGRDIARYHDRHRVKSGITGWAQVHGLRGPTSLVDRIEWDNYYIAHWSLRLDLKILILTAIAVFRGE